MMRVGILTIYGGSNFGNKLQNYALQQFLKDEGVDAETIRYTVSLGRKQIGKREKIELLRKKYFSQGAAESFWNVRSIVNAKIHKDEIRRKKAERNAKFQQFEQKNIVLSNRVIQNPEDLADYSEQYDAVVVGSDQVWNPYWQGSLDAFFLDFVPRNKRIAYAPSIGVSEIPEAQKIRFQRLLNGFDRLSCREYQGCKVIHQLTGKHCQHVCDPVFLLSPEQWKKWVHQEPKKNVVTYFLGGQSQQTHREITRFAKANNCEVVDLWSDKDHASKYAGIEEFLNYIANAKMFFTDSFHGCAFAILLKTQFVICDRKAIDKEQKMNSRLDSLMQILDIQGRKLEEFTEKTPPIDFEQVHNKLLPWVEESKKYLRDCLNGNS